MLAFESGSSLLPPLFTSSPFFASSLLTCSSDPFVEMARNDKKYGYTMALWERGDTAPTLFRKVSDYKKARGIRSTSTWKAMITPMWVPAPFRSFLSLLPGHDAAGDEWNYCHYWSNFEIADLDFFRSTEYGEYFDMLDRSGGFYFERVRLAHSARVARD